MKDEIILIGPIGTGKSTLGKMLAESLGIAQCPMDEHRWGYYKEIGYDEKRADQIRESQGFEGVLRYWKPFEVHAVERLLSEHQDYVIDFGAGHSVFEDEELFARVQKALDPYPNVILVLPSPDEEESLHILRTRKYNPGPQEYDANAHFVGHPSNHRLAKMVVYTQDKTPEQTRDEILALVGKAVRKSGD